MVLITAYAAFFFVVDDSRLKFSAPDSFNSGWSVRLDDGKTKKLDQVSREAAGNANDVLVLVNTIPTDQGNASAICFETKMSVFAYI